MATFHTQLQGVLPPSKHRLHVFSLHGSQHTPTPPLSASWLRWMACLHSHMTLRGKGARLCASLTGLAAALTVPLFSHCDSGVLGKLLLRRLSCPSVGRTGRLCPGESRNTCVEQKMLCFSQVKVWTTTGFLCSLGLPQLLSYQLL